MKKLLILVNTGTPASPGVGKVRRYLSEFLNDGKVIDIPWLWRKILVNLIIVPFRAPRSASLYRKIWTDEGSPLLVNLQKLVRKVQEKVDKDTLVIGAMRYGQPSLTETLRGIPALDVEEVKVFPLYPHYASSTSGSVGALVKKEAGKWKVSPELKITGQYYSSSYYLEALTKHIKNHSPAGFDHVLFTYHGLPLRHVSKIHQDVDPDACGCETAMPAHGSSCYKATCHETSRLLAGSLHLKPGSWSTSFQSRLSKNWLTPFTDRTLKELALSGKRSILVIAPSFAADCLETLEEVGQRYKEIFLGHGGEEFVLVPALNDDDKWAKAIVDISCA